MIRDAVVILAVSLILSIIGLLFLKVATLKSKEARCKNNLQEIGLAFHLASLQGDEYPHGLSTNQGQIELGLLAKGETNSAVWGTRELHTQGDPFFTYRTFSNDLKRTATFICPTDNRKAAATWNSMSNQNTSYFLNLDTKPNQFVENPILLGDRNVLVNSNPVRSGRVPVGPLSNLSFDQQLHHFRGHFTRNDGSVLLIRKSFRATNSTTLAIP